MVHITFTKPQELGAISFFVHNELKLKRIFMRKVIIGKKTYRMFQNMPCDVGPEEDESQEASETEEDS